MPKPQVEGHPLSAVRDCLFNIYPSYLETVSSIRSLRTHHAVVTRYPLNTVLKPMLNKIKSTETIKLNKCRDIEL
jgi:hypothetical protein